MTASVRPDDPPPGDLSRLIAGAEDGSAAGASALFTALYSELHRLARCQSHLVRGGRGAG